MHLVTEGAARDVADIETVDVVRSPRSGDDSIVETAAAADGIVVVVTADRELRQRCAEVGSSVVGPRWLTSRL